MVGPALTWLKTAPQSTEGADADPVSEIGRSETVSVR